MTTLPAGRITGTATGTGAVPAGVTQYTYVVDRGTGAGVVTIQTAAKEGATDLEADTQVVDLMASKIEIAVIAIPQ